jgi:hypothetical protein
MVVKALFGIAQHALSIYNTKLSRKYLDRTIELEKLYYAEQSKPEDKRNHALMDNIINELCLITETIASFGKESIKN